MIDTNSSDRYIISRSFAPAMSIMPNVHDSSSVKNSPFPDVQSLIAGIEKTVTISEETRNISLK